MSTYPVLFPEVFEGGNGDLVIVQEWPDLKGETFVRVMLPMAEARRLAAAILVVAEMAERGRDNGTDSNDQT